MSFRSFFHGIMGTLAVWVSANGVTVALFVELIWNVNSNCFTSLGSFSPMRTVSPILSHTSDFFKLEAIWPNSKVIHYIGIQNLILFLLETFINALEIYRRRKRFCMISLLPLKVLKELLSLRAAHVELPHTSSVSGEVEQHISIHMFSLHSSISSGYYCYYLLNAFYGHNIFDWMSHNCLAFQ